MNTLTRLFGGSTKQYTRIDDNQVQLVELGEANADRSLVVYRLSPGVYIVPSQSLPPGENPADVAWKIGTLPSGSSSPFNVRGLLFGGFDAVVHVTSAAYRFLVDATAPVTCQEGWQATAVGTQLALDPIVSNSSLAKLLNHDAGLSSSFPATNEWIIVSAWPLLCWLAHQQQVGI